MIQTIDLATVHYLKEIVGKPSEKDIIPLPSLFASQHSVDKRLHVFGMGYLNDDLVRYPFTIINKIGGEEFIVTTKDPVYIYPFALLSPLIIARYNIYILDRATGKLDRFLEMSRTQAVKLEETIDNKYSVVAIPSLIENNFAEDLVRFKIIGGNLYENMPTKWKHVLTYDIRMSQDESFKRGNNDKRKEMASGKGIILG